jgi:hypothetical protein
LIYGTLTLRAVVGVETFEGYTYPFQAPGSKQRDGIKLHTTASTRSTQPLSVCPLRSCSPYCSCHTSPRVAFLFHTDCVQLLHTHKIPLRALWTFARSIQPCFSNFDTMTNVQQLRSLSRLAFLPNLVYLPSTVAGILERFASLPLELRAMILDQTERSARFSAITVVSDTLPLLKKVHRRDFYNKSMRLDSCQRIYAAYTTIRGQQYLSKLSNEPSEEMTMVHEASRPLLVILSFDDLGIRGACFVTHESSSNPTIPVAPWYRFERISPDSDGTFTITYNVSDTKLH